MADEHRSEVPLWILVTLLLACYAFLLWSWGAWE